MTRCSNCARFCDPAEIYCAACGWRVHEPDEEVSIPGIIGDTTGVTFFPNQPTESRRTPARPGPPIVPGRRALRTLPCPHCTRPIDRSLPFCSYCGLKTGFPSHDTGLCSFCGARLSEEGARYCSACGTAVPAGADTPGLPSSTQPRAMAPIVRSLSGGPRLALLNDEGAVVREILLEREETVLGRVSADVQFDDDDSISPQHAVLTWRDNSLRVRDLGSSNGSWLFITQSHALTEGDLLLIGSQVIRYRVLTPKPQTETFATAVRLDTPVSPVADVAMLEQLRPDGSVRDVLYLSPGRSVLIGREHGDWVFPYDQTMSGRHAEVRSVVERVVEREVQGRVGIAGDGSSGTDDWGETLFTVRDVGSRNGVGILVRGERALRAGERLMVGRKLLRLDVP